MRFFYKRPKIDDVRDELNTLMEVMMSDFFVVLDIFLFSVIFTLLLFPTFHSVKIVILSFFGSFGTFNILYFFVFNRFFRKRFNF